MLAVNAADEQQIVGTVHAIFDPTRPNPDGSSHAWISNLTIIPPWRGRGLGRMLLTTGLTNLYKRGAKSVALGVDGGNPTPVALYPSMNFEIISSLAVWTTDLTSTVARKTKDAVVTP